MEIQPVLVLEISGQAPKFKIYRIYTDAHEKFPLSKLN